MIIIRNKEEKEIIRQLRAIANEPEVAKRSQELLDLREQINTLKIDKSRLQEEHAKEDRELRHMIGLEKKRQEFEITKAIGEATLKVREANLAAEQKRFNEQLTFNTERFAKAEENLKGILEQIIQRLPNVNMEFSRKSKDQ